MTNSEECSERTLDNECMICCINKANAVVMPCGHGGMCHECALNIFQGQEKCAICRNVRQGLKQKIAKVLQLERDKKTNLDVVVVAWVNQNDNDPIKENSNFEIDTSFQNQSQNIEEDCDQIEESDILSEA